MSAPSRGRSILGWLPRLLIVAAITTMAPVLRAQQQAPEQPAAVSASPAKAQATHAQKSREQTDGERVFAENCSRCHAMPEGFSSHISGTIVRHMRVRASLSEEDAKALLRFFNPQ